MVPLAGQSHHEPARRVYLRMSRQNLSRAWVLEVGDGGSGMREGHICYLLRYHRRSVRLVLAAGVACRRKPLLGPKTVDLAHHARATGCAGDAQGDSVAHAVGRWNADPIPGGQRCLRCFRLTSS